MPRLFYVLQPFLADRPCIEELGCSQIREEVVNVQIGRDI
jgi:hypothetical protein